MSQTWTKNKRVLLHLSLIDTVGPVTGLKLLRRLHHEVYPDLLHVGWIDVIEHQAGLDFEQLYHYSTYDFIKKLGFTEKLASTLVQGLAHKALLDQELALLEKHQVHLTTLLDENYPEILKQIQNPPLVLYSQGGFLHRSSKLMGIVGSRKASDYAAKVIGNIVPALVVQGWDIASGGAEGADTMAHEAALAAGGKTIAVLGSGLLHPYPSSNKDLFKRMVEAGSIVLSPFPLRMFPDKPNFPARNRIIAGLSLGCVIVQAAKKSGALITAYCALEQGRQVFAVPGLIYEDLSAGCHELIKQGAKLVNSVTDILEEFGELSFVGQQIGKQQIAPATQLARKPLQQQEQDPILSFLSESATLDELLEKTGFDAEKLQGELFMLQLDGKVRQNFVGTWERI